MNARRHSPRNVVARITEELQSQILSGALRKGLRLPSVRELAREREISAFSAAEIYSSLVALGTVEAHAGQGYFVAGWHVATDRPVSTPEFPADSVWERRREASGRAVRVDAGCGWLPNDWLHGDGVRAALRAVARQPALHVDGYGDPRGLHVLRAHLSTVLHSRGIRAKEDQIVLTQGASQALDLVVRECLAPGDAAIVEDPGYPPIFELLKQRGVQVLGVARTEDGPDVSVLARLLKNRRVRCFFTNTSGQNPTGTSTGPATAHQVLELMDRHGVTVVEDDIFADLAMRPGATLASLDELQRVIYISSFSKTLSPSLRAGYMAVSPALTQRLARAKIVSSLGSSELLEQIVLQVLTRGHYRRHLRRLQERLSAAHLWVAREFEARGVEFAFRPQAGPFFWARLPSRDSVSKVWRLALEQGVLLAPGELFRVDGKSCPYWRFNVAQCQAPDLLRFLEKL